MHITIPIYSIGPYSLAFVVGLVLYWNASLIFSRSLTAFMATMIAMKLDLAFHLLYACMHHVVAIACRLRTFWDPQDVLNHFQAHSQLYVIVDIGTIALLVGNTLHCWSAALVTRLALSALATRAEIWMRRWESQSVVEHVVAALTCVTCIAGCTLQWAYYTLLPRSEIEAGGFASLLMWYTSIVYIVAIGARATSALVTILMRLFGYRVLQRATNTPDRILARALEDSGLNPYAEVHELYMSYLYSVVCAFTAWYYAPSSLPMWIQGFVLFRLYFIASASGELRRYKQVLERFPLVSADPSKACAICRDDFVSGEPVTCLPCGHTFHGACVRSWLMRAATCPTCRQPVADATWRAAAAHHTVVRGAAAATGHLSGSVQPLAPRLHAAGPAARAPAAALRPRSLRRRPRSPPGAAASTDTSPALASALARITAERCALAEARGRLLSLPQSPAQVPPPAVEREDDVDPLLFTDIPLAAAAPVNREAGSSDRRRKRSRAPVAAVASGGHAAEGEEEEEAPTQQRRV